MAASLPGVADLRTMVVQTLALVMVAGCSTGSQAAKPESASPQSNNPQSTNPQLVKPEPAKPQSAGLRSTGPRPAETAQQPPIRPKGPRCTVPESLRTTIERG